MRKLNLNMERPNSYLKNKNMMAEACGQGIEIWNPRFEARPARDPGYPKLKTHLPCT